LITYTTTTLKLVTAKFHVSLQEFLMVMSAVAQWIKKEFKEYGMKPINHAVVQKTYHFGMENIVLSAPLELNSMPRRGNAITAQTDSLEITPAHPAFQDFDYFDSVIIEHV
jgi:hypothetical protein